MNAVRHPRNPLRRALLLLVLIAAVVAAALLMHAPLAPEHTEHDGRAAAASVATGSEAATGHGAPAGTAMCAGCTGDDGTHAAGAACLLLLVIGAVLLARGAAFRARVRRIRTICAGRRRGPAHARGWPSPSLQELCISRT